MNTASSDSSEPIIVKTEADRDGPPVHERVGFVLTYAVFGAPVAWSLQLLVNYAFSAHACFPSNHPLAIPVWHWVWWFVMGVDCIAIIAAGLAGYAAVTKWFQYRDCDPAAVGARRNRFLALWAMLISGLFFTELIFSIVMVFILPTCAS